MKAVQELVPGMSGALPDRDAGMKRVAVGDGQERDLRILGAYPEYRTVRDLVVVPAGFSIKKTSKATTKSGSSPIRWRGKFTALPKLPSERSLPSASFPSR